MNLTAGLRHAATCCHRFAICEARDSHSLRAVRSRDAEARPFFANCQVKTVRPLSGRDSLTRPSLYRGRPSHSRSGRHDLPNREAMTACSPMRKRGVKQQRKLSRETATEHTTGIRRQGHPGPECANRQGEDALVTFLP